MHEIGGACFAMRDGVKRIPFLALSAQQVSDSFGDNGPSDDDHYPARWKTSLLEMQEKQTHCRAVIFWIEVMMTETLRRLHEQLRLNASSVGSCIIF